MQVARVISPVSSRESWTVLGEDDAPVEPVERYLAYLSDIERSPNTVKAYAHDLKDWFDVPRPVAAWIGGRCGWRMWVGSWRGCGCRCRPATGGSRAADGGASSARSRR